MKKLLIILLLLFSVSCSENETKAKDFPDGFFGLKFGDKFNKEILDVYYYLGQKEVTGEGYNKEDIRIFVKPPKPSTYFDSYQIHLSPISKRIFFISSFSTHKMTLKECKERIAEVSLKLEEKYKKLPAFSLDSHAMKKTGFDWYASTIRLDKLLNKGKEKMFKVPLEIIQVCKTDTNSSQHLFLSHNKKLKILNDKEEEKLKNQGF